MRINQSSRRGLPPKLDGATIAAFLMGNTDFVVDVDNAAEGPLVPAKLAQFAALGIPANDFGHTAGSCRRFFGSQILAAAVTAPQVVALQGTWTWSVWFKPAAYPVSTGVIIGLSGHVDDEASTANSPALLCMDSLGRPSVIWEQGAGVDVVGTAPDPMPLGEWTLITVRKVVSGINALRDILVNGRVVSSATVLNATGVPTTAKYRWVMGGVLTAAGALSLPVTGSVGPSLCTLSVLSDFEVGEQFRRGASLATPYAVTMSASIRESAGGSFRDVSSFYGFDFLSAVTITDSVDSDMRSAEITLTRENGETSMAPLKGDSSINNVTLAPTYTPKLNGWREVRISDARTPLFVPPGAFDFALAFTGRIDELDDSDSGMITLSCRDESARASERYISTEVVYPTVFGGPCGASAQSREVVIQQILTNNGGLFTLDVPVPTLSCMVVMQQPLPRGFLLPSIRNLAREIGWDLRYKWNPLAGGWRLTMFEPQRTRLAPHYIIAANDVESTAGGRQQTANVRNSWTVTYPDAATTDGEGIRLPASVTVTDAISIADYDLRAAEVIEDGSSQIDSSPEALRMASGALADTKSPTRNVGKVIGFDSRTEVGDIVQIQPSGLDTTVDQYAAVQQVDHQWSALQGSRTTLRMEGNPSAGFNRWLSIEAGRNGRPPIRDPGEALTGRGIGTLLPGVLDIVDRSIYLGGQKFIEVKNGDFARFTRGIAYPPDSWSMDAGTWTTNITALSSTQLSGGFGIRIAATAPRLAAQPIPLVGDIDTPYGVEVLWQRQSGDDLVQVDLQWLDVNRALLATSTLYPGGPGFGFVGVDKFPVVPATTGVWYLSRAEGLVPASGARFLRVVLRGRQVGGAFSPIVIDNVQVFRAARRTKTGLCLDAAFRPLWTNFIGRPATTGIVAATVSNLPVLDIAAQSTMPEGEVYDVYQQLARSTNAATVNGAFYLVKEDGKLRIRARVWFPNAGVAAGQPIALELVRNGLYSTANGTRTGFGTGPSGAAGAIIVSNRVFKTAGPGSQNYLELDFESYFLKGDRLTLDFRNDAAAGVQQIRFGSALAGAEDRTYFAVDTRVAD